MQNVQSIGFMSPVDIQLANEHSYSKKNIDKYIRQEIVSNEELMVLVSNGVELLANWIDGTYYESKNLRLNQLKPLDLNVLVVDVLVGVAYCQIAEQFTSVAAQLAHRVGFNDKADAILTMSEILAVLCRTDIFDIIKCPEKNTLTIKSHIPISKQVITYIEQSAYLPPMVCEPNTITHNRQSGYLTHNDSVILKNNHHSDPVSLDVLNIVNKTALTIDIDFLQALEEMPTFELDSIDKTQNWEKFKSKSMEFYGLISEQAKSNDNKVYLNHKFDKRGRVYPQGYWINTMGAAYKKASLELANQEFIDVPSEYQV